MSKVNEQAATMNEQILQYWSSKNFKNQILRLFQKSGLLQKP